MMEVRGFCRTLQKPRTRGLTDADTASKRKSPVETRRTAERVINAGKVNRSLGWLQLAVLVSESTGKQ